MVIEAEFGAAPCADPTASAPVLLGDWCGVIFLLARGQIVAGVKRLIADSSPRRRGITASLRPLPAKIVGHFVINLPRVAKDEKSIKLYRKAVGLIPDHLTLKLTQARR
jgi:hypothetical protein